MMANCTTFNVFYYSFIEMEKDIFFAPSVLLTIGTGSMDIISSSKGVALEIVETYNNSSGNDDRKCVDIIDNNKKNNNNSIERDQNHIKENAIYKIVTGNTAVKKDNDKNNKKAKHNIITPLLKVNSMRNVGDIIIDLYAQDSIKTDIILNNDNKDNNNNNNNSINNDINDNNDIRKCPVGEEFVQEDYGSKIVRYMKKWKSTASITSGEKNSNKFTNLEDQIIQSGRDDSGNDNRNENRNVNETKDEKISNIMAVSCSQSLNNIDNNSFCSSHDINIISDKMKSMSDSNNSNDNTNSSSSSSSSGARVLGMKCKRDDYQTRDGNGEISGEFDSDNNSELILITETAKETATASITALMDLDRKGQDNGKEVEEEEEEEEDDVIKYVGARKKNQLEEFKKRIAADPNSWKCTKCCELNSVRARSCSMCGEKKVFQMPPEPIKKESTRGKWRRTKKNDDKKNEADTGKEMKIEMIAAVEAEMPKMILIDSPVFFDDLDLDTFPVPQTLDLDT